jgi:hypothetical protein
MRNTYTDSIVVVFGKELIQELGEAGESAVEERGREWRYPPEDLLGWIQRSGDPSLGFVMDQELTSSQ